MLGLPRSLHTVLPYFALDLGGSSFDVGALQGVFGIGQFVGNFVMGKASDKFGRKPIIIISLFTR